MSVEIALYILGPVSFAVGVICGMAIYRALWHIDTATLRAEMARSTAHNQALQDQLFDVQKQLEEMRARVRILEETNNELIQRERASRAT